MKKWYFSKTVWVNLLAFIAVALQAKTGHEVLDPSTQTLIITVANLVLRKFTKSEIK